MRINALTFKKLVLVSATSALVTEASLEDTSVTRVPYIHYLVQFQKGDKQV